ncbi:MAG TPA: hypothetical protein VK437_06950 [Steroidobacteraceae bacterium]|nr:hypothetical protein [Steroidobacteraceae bacterium]
MLLLAAITRLAPDRAQHLGSWQSNPALGHLGLTIIALVYVLIIMWQV